MEITGKIIFDIPMVEGVSKAGNPWKKKEWVLETQGQYPRRVKFDLFGDRVDSVKLQLNHTYTIQYDLESREFNGRWYTDVRAYAAVEVPDGSAAGMTQGGFTTAAPASPMSAAPAAPAADPFGNDSNNTDDLPF